MAISQDHERSNKSKAVIPIEADASGWSRGTAGGRTWFHPLKDDIDTRIFEAEQQNE